MDELWGFLNQPTDQTWLHTLFGGLVSAIIGALVAVAVVMVTVRTQNAGIKKQLKAQDESVQEQLRVQRSENAKSREYEAAGRLLSALRNYAPSVGADRPNGQPMVPSALERIHTMNSSFEELRLDLGADDDGVIDAFLRLVSCLHLATLDFKHHKKERFEYPFLVIARVESLLIEQVVKYIRSGTQGRVLMKPFLHQASNDVEVPDRQWLPKYGNY